ncbi:protein transport protein sft2 [Mycoblastus sanguinarius]|nr:protein transport protein sft2 [Mycoblastus sanguinarius]
MASTSFRDSMNSMGWSRRDPDIPVNTSSTPILSRLQSLNPFGDGGYVRLPTQSDGPGAPLPAPTRREEEEGFFACESTNLPQSSGAPISACDKTQVPAQPLSSHA